MFEFMMTYKYIIGTFRVHLEKKVVIQILLHTRLKTNSVQDHERRFVTEPVKHNF